MNISMNVSSALAQSSGSDAVSMTVLKKAIDAEAQAAQALINAIPQPPAQSNLPPHLGQIINTVA